MIKIYLLFSKQIDFARIGVFLLLLLFMLCSWYYASAQADCQFQEAGGLAVIETEAVNVPSNWSATKNSNLTFIEWDDKEYFNTPGNGTITYNLNVTKPGLYKFVWRNKVNSGTATNEHNDTWLRIPNNENIVFFGHKGSEANIEADLKAKNEFIVFPKDTNLGNPVAGPSSDGWFKIYNGALTWNWDTETNEEDPYDVYVIVNAPGVVSIEVSGRASFHAIDKMVLYHLETYGRNGLSDEQLHGFKASSNNCTGISFTNSNSDGKCDFEANNGIILIETESNIIPTGWGIVKSNGKTFIEWDNPSQFDKPGPDAFSYSVNVKEAGIYRIQINSRINEGTNNSEHNDTWLKMANNENIVFFGYKGSGTAAQIETELAKKSTKIVFPAGTGLGNTVAGPSVDGWFKYFSKGINWNWGTFTNEENPYDVYVKFNSPGLYEVQLGGRAQYHALDKIVLYNIETNGNSLDDATLNSFVESGCSSRLAYTNDSKGDSLALLLLHKRTGGTGWTNPWVLSQPMSQWSGVVLDATRRVIELTLQNRGLTGQLPREIGYLSKLTKLNISGNSGLGGRVPDEVGDIAGLVTLIMSDNGMGGSFPESISKLTKLVTLNIANNSISGALPTGLDKLLSLKVIRLENNSLSGPLPEGIGNLKGLTELSLANNGFTGPIPASIGGPLGLKLLNLTGNQLTGGIPGGVNALTVLETLSMGNNLLTGAIPVGIGGLTLLKTLNLDNNQLTGEIPPSFDNLKALTSLNLSMNQLTGIISPGLGSIAGLKTVNLHGNLLTGAVPANLVNLPGLTELTLANNDLSALPAATSTTLTNITVEGNKLSFDDIIPNKAKLTSYAPQDSVGEKRSVSLIKGDQLVIDLGIDQSIQTSLYEWHKDSVLFKLTLTSKLVLDNVTDADLGVYTCKITNSSAPDLILYSNPVNVIINSPPTFTSTPVTSVSSGIAYTYNITTTDPNSDDSLSIGSTVLPAWLTLTDNGDGTAVLTGTPAVGDCSDDSVALVVKDRGLLTAVQSFKIAIAVAFSVTVDTSKAAICRNEPVTFTANLVNPGPNPTYQWLIDDKPLAGATANNITTSALVDNQTVKVQVKVDSTACLVNTTAVSQPIVIKVTDFTTMSVLLSIPDPNLCSSDTAIFSSTLINPGPNPVYQWLINDAPVAGATQASLITSQVNNGDVVKVKVTSDNPGCLLNTEATSEPVTLTITESKILDISLTADKTELEAGEAVTFTAATTYTSSATQYQWFVNNEQVADQTGTTFTSSTLASNDKVKVKILAEPVACLSATEVTSQEITIMVNADITLTNLQKATEEETELGFTVAEFTAAYTSSLGDLSKVKITVLPTNGTLTLEGTAVQKDQEIGLDKIAGLKYKPATNFSGTETIKWNGSEGTQYGPTDGSIIIQISAVNDPPVFTLSGNIKVALGFTTTETVTVTPGAIPADEVGQTVTYSVQPATLPFANMSIDPNTGTVSITAFDLRFGIQEVEIIANDGQAENNTYAQSFGVEVTNPNNSAPYDITLASAIIPESVPVDSVATLIIVGDFNVDDVHTITLDNSIDAPDNGYFKIDGIGLKVAQALDFESKNKLTIALKAADPSGSSLTKQFVITIGDANDLPTNLTLSDSTVREGAGVGTIVGTFITADEDRADRHTYTLLPESEDIDYFTLAKDKLVIKNEINYQEKRAFTITVRSEDGRGGKIDRTLNLIVQTTNEAFAKIKTGITPHVDGLNDTWKIEDIEDYPNAKVEIFDSWGKRVFYSEGYQREWDGTRDNEELPTGTYYYVIDLNNGGTPIKGTVTLLR